MNHKSGIMDETAVRGPLRLDISIPSQIEHIKLVDDVVSYVLKGYEMEDTERDYAGLAVHEVVANAIVHGNKEDARLYVQVSFYLHHDSIRVVVEDEGDGFDPEQLPDPTDPANLLKPHGRGLLYVRNFMDHIVFKRGSRGMMIILEKKAPFKGLE